MTVKPDAATAAHSLNDLTPEERYILSCALSEPNDVINLPVVISSYSRLNAQKAKTYDAIKISIYRAAKRLNNRGLADVEKYGGLIWVHAHRDELACLIIHDRRQNVSRKAVA